MFCIFFFGLFQDRKIAGTADEQTALGRLGDAVHNIITRFYRYIR